MASSPATYNPRVFYVENPEERDQCQFVYDPRDGGKPVRCQRDGTYRIGLVIFLCGIHTPGVGRHPNTKPVGLKKNQEIKIKPASSNKYLPLLDRLLSFFESNKGIAISYNQIMEQFPNLDCRQYLFIAVCRLRKEKGAKIETVKHLGYRYLGHN